MIPGESAGVLSVSKTGCMCDATRGPERPGTRTAAPGGRQPASGLRRRRLHCRAAVHAQRVRRLALRVGMALARAFTGDWGASRWASRWWTRWGRRSRSSRRRRAQRSGNCASCPRGRTGCRSPAPSARWRCSRRSRAGEGGRVPIALLHAGAANSPVIEGSAEAHRSQAQGCDPTTDVIAVPWAGRVPYATGRPTLDMLGLNDTHIAHLPSLQRGIDVKMDPEYVLARRPKLIPPCAPEFARIMEQLIALFAESGSDEPPSRWCASVRPPRPRPRRSGSVRMPHPSSPARRAVARFALIRQSEGSVTASTGAGSVSV